MHKYVIMRDALTNSGSSGSSSGGSGGGGGSSTRIQASNMKQKGVGWRREGEKERKARGMRAGNAICGEERKTDVSR